MRMRRIKMRRMRLRMIEQCLVFDVTMLEI
jgi:hypothetical protein